LQLATSDDLLHWTHRADVDTGAAQGTIAPLGPTAWVVGYEKRLGDGIHLRFRDYANESDLLAGHYEREFTAPLTLSPTAEGTPSIVSADDSRIVIGFHYYRNSIADREAEGVLTDFTTWRSAPVPTLDAEFARFGITGNIGD